MQWAAPRAPPTEPFGWRLALPRAPGCPVWATTPVAARTAPCKTFAGAISKTSAGGEIDSLDPGGFGALTITHAITIDGSGGGKSSVLVAGSNGIVVAAGPSDVVTLRHLQIQGIGSGLNGIRFIGGKALILEDVVIEGFTQNGVDASLAANGSSLIIRNSSIHNNAGAGVSVTTTKGLVRTSISGTELAGNHDGLLGGSGANVDLSTSVIASNAAVGVGCKTSGTTSCVVHTAHDQIDHNGTGISAARSAGSATIVVTLSDDDIIGNTVGISIPGARSAAVNVYSFLNNRFVNNGGSVMPTGTLRQG